MVQSYKSSQAFRIGSGRARALLCQNISGLHTKRFDNIRSRPKDFLFRDERLLCSPR